MHPPVYILHQLQISRYSKISEIIQGNDTSQRTLNIECLLMALRVKYLMGRGRFFRDHCIEVVNKGSTIKDLGGAEKILDANFFPPRKPFKQFFFLSPPGGWYIMSPLWIGYVCEMLTSLLCTYSLSLGVHYESGG